MTQVEILAAIDSRRCQIRSLESEVDSLLKQLSKITFDPPRRDMQIATGYLNGRKQVALAVEFGITQQAVAKILKRTLPHIYHQMQIAQPTRIVRNAEIAAKTPLTTEDDEL